MKIRVTGVVVDAQAFESGGTNMLAMISVSAVDVDSDTHHLSPTPCGAIVPADVTINELNDSLIQAVIDFIEASTPGVTYGWSVNRDNVRISGLFQRA